MKKLIFILILGVSGISAVAQCEFDLNVSVQNSDCIASGVITVGLSGDAIDLSKGVNIILSDNIQDRFSTTNNQPFTGLQAGEYTITARAFCKSSNSEVIQTKIVTITSDYTVLHGNISSYRKPLSCINTGMISINISGGKAPYTIEMVSSPSTYSGPTVFQKTEQGNISFNDLPPGEYKFTVTDNCSYEIKNISINLVIVDSNFPTEPDEYSISPIISTNSCNKVLLYVRYVRSTMVHYWDNGVNYYEVAISINGIETEWMPFTWYITHTYTFTKELTLPYTIKEIRDNKYPMEVKLRLKNCPDVVQNYNLTLSTAKIDAYIQSVSDINTCYFIYNFYPSHICFPYSWEIKDSDGNVAASGTGIADKTTQTASLSYNKQYILTITDKEGYQVTNTIETDTLYFLHHHEEINCDSLKYTFYPNHYCPPYSWEIRETLSDNLIKSLSGITNGAPQTITLAYDKEYTLKITDENGKTIKYDIYIDYAVMYDYKSEYEFCLPDTFHSYYHFWLTDRVIPAGTRIQTSGPNGILSDVTLDKDMSSYYPFSDNHEEQQWVKLKDGKYTFKITICEHSTFEKTWELQNYEIRNFSYVQEETCNGLRIFPTGEFYSNNIPSGAYYEMKEAPQGAFKPIFHSSDTDAINKSGQYFSLSIPGRYIFYIYSLFHWGCPADSIVIDYEQEDLFLDNYSAYTCSQDGVPQFNIRAKNGISPYTYELFENGNFIEDNRTGDFNYGNISNTYSIKVTDSCGRSFRQDIPIIDIFNVELIDGKNQLCAGDTILFNCTSFGSSNFSWTGPNGFSSDKQSFSIPDATADNSGTYTITLQPFGCSSTVSRSVEVTVRKLDILPENLPSYKHTVAYEQDLTTNAVSPNFTVSEGNLPDGLVLSPAGKISGTVLNSGHPKTEFTVKVEDPDGCIAFHEYVLEGDLIVPKAFTPNGDGVNDIFMRNNKIVIFDRLGIIMFEGENGWDGTYKGKIVAPDIYFYKLFYLNNQGETKIITGYVGVAI
jgi:gliding motility-associated-like protein